jgi:DNA-binding NtrC family response regulator
VRELKNVVERALVLAGASGRIDPIHLQLPEAVGPNDTVPPIPYGATPQGGIGAVDLRAQREHWEKQQILGALEKTSGNQKEAAKILGISRRTLINKIEAYGIARPRKRP